MGFVDVVEVMTLLKFFTKSNWGSAEEYSMD